MKFLNPNNYSRTEEKMIFARTQRAFLVKITITLLLSLLGIIGLSNKIKAEGIDVIFENTSDAVNYLREQMVERKDMISFVYRIPIPNEGLPEGTAISIYDEAMQVTDDPHEGDYLKYSVRSRYASTDILDNDGEYSYFRMTYQMRYLTTKEEEENLDQLVKNLISELDINNEKTKDIDKVKKVYDYLGKNVYYDHEGYQDELDQIESGAENIEWVPTHSAYVALTTNKSLCQGYALSMYRILKEVNVDVRFIRGVGYKDDSPEHAIHDYNIVKIDGKWYYIDANWGAMFKEKSGGNSEDIDYSWFLKSKQDFVYHEVDTNDFTADHEIFCLENADNENYTSISYNEGNSQQIEGYDTSYTFYNLENEEVRKPEDKIVVMTFFRNGWVNTNYWLKQLAQSKFFNSDDVIFCAIDINYNPDYSELINTADNTGFGRKNIMYQSDNYISKKYLSDLATNMLYQAGYDEYDLYFNYNMPVTMVIDKSNRISYVVAAGKESNEVSIPVYLTTEYLDAKIDYLQDNPTKDIREEQDAPTSISSIGVQVPNGSGKYAGTLVGIDESMEYRFKDSNVYYSGNDGGNITGLDAGTYFVRYKGTNTAKPSKETEILIAPAAPRGTLKTTNNIDGSLKVSWGEVDGAIGYQLYRSTDSQDLDSYKLIATIDNAEFIDKDVKDGTTYYYRLKSYNVDSQGKKYFSDFSGYTGKTAKVPAKIYSGGIAVESKDMYVGMQYTMKYVISSLFPEEKVEKVEVDDSTAVELDWDKTNAAIYLKPISSGKTYLRIVLSGGYEAKCLLDINNSISLTENKINLYIGDTYKIKPILTPDTQKVTYWVGNKSIASVDSKGVITGISEGNTYLYAESSNNQTVRCLISVVKKNSVVSVSVRYTEKTIYVGSSFQFTTTIIPENATDKTVTYRTGNNKVAIVDEKGKVTGISEGNTYLYATASNGISTKCLLKIKNVPVTSLSIRYTEKTIYIGNSFQFTATITPDNATDKTVTYCTGNSDVAIVDESGKVTGISEGNTYLYATASNGLSVKCLLRIKNIPVTSLSIRYTEKTIYIGDSFQFTATITPDNATNKTVTYRTGNSDVAIVDETGNVTGVSVGNTYLYATTVNDISVRCLIKVKE